MTDRILKQSEVTAEETAWARAILNDATTYPMGAWAMHSFDPPGITVRARVEWHGYRGATPAEHLNHPIRGVTLYEALGAELQPAVKAAQRMQVTAQRTQGVDVSHYQQSVDWKRLSTEGNVAFAYVKATEGKTITDDMMAKHHAGTGDNGVLRGPYHFFRITSDPVEQVRRFMDEAWKVGDWELPPCIDAEWQSTKDALGGHSASEFFDCLYKAVRELASMGRRPLLYTAPGFWGMLPNGEIEELTDLWLAHYTQGAPHVPGDWPAWRIWQDTASASLPGYGGKADHNYFAGSLADLKAWAGVEHLPTQAELDQGGRDFALIDAIDRGEEGLKS